MKGFAAYFLKDESGVSGVEYAVIGALGVVVVLAMIGAFSEALSGWAESLSARMTIN